MSIYSGGLQGTPALTDIGILSGVGGTFVGGSALVADLSADCLGSAETGKTAIYGIVFLNKSAYTKAVAIKGGAGPVETLAGEKALTNYGKKLLLQCLARKTFPEYFRLVLCTDDATGTFRPTPETEDFSSLREINHGHGYVKSGVRLNLDEVDIPTLSVDAATDTAFMQFKSVVFTALGGSLPNGGNPVHYAVLLDDQNKVVSYYVVSESGMALSHGQSLALQSFRVTLA